MKCSICQEIFIDPVVVVCGHNFCKDCIKEWQKNFIEENPYEEPCPCPECRTVFKTVYPNISLKNYINDLSAVILDEEEKKKREETIKERLEKKVTPILSAGDNDETIPNVNLAHLANFLAFQNLFNSLAATPTPADVDTAGAGVGAIQGEERLDTNNYTPIPGAGDNNDMIQSLAEFLSFQNAPDMAVTSAPPDMDPADAGVGAIQSHQHNMELINASFHSYLAPELEQTPVAPTLHTSQLLSVPNAPSHVPTMNVLERNIQEQAENRGNQSQQHTMELNNASSHLYQGQAPALGQTPVAPTLITSQHLSAPNAPSFTPPPMNLVEPDSTTLDSPYFHHFNGRAATRILPRPSPYSREQDHPRRSTNQTRTVGALWNPL